MRQRKRTSIISLVVGVGLSVGLLVTGAQAQSGSLAPPGSAVDGTTGDPVATTQTQPSWVQVLPADERFVLVMGGAAVLDKETGLVWEQAPSTSERFWLDSRSHCLNLTVGGRMGWRLPSLHELMSLVDPNNPDDTLQQPQLPPDHPFSNVSPTTSYWTSMLGHIVAFGVGANADDLSQNAWVVRFNDFTNSKPSFDRGLFHFRTRAVFGQTFLSWCVRGGGPLALY